MRNLEHGAVADSPRERTIHAHVDVFDNHIDAIGCLLEGDLITHIRAESAVHIHYPDT